MTSIGRSSEIMHLAIEQAMKAYLLGEIPVGAVITTNSGDIVAQSHNTVYLDKDPLAHAEMNVLKSAAKIFNNTKLDDYDLYVTLEPCTMCAAAISIARIRRVFFGSYDVKGGGIEHGVHFFSAKTCLHKPEVYGGFLEKECNSILKNFFSEIRLS